MTFKPPAPKTLITLSALSVLPAAEALAVSGTGAVSAVIMVPVVASQSISGTLNFGSFALTGSGTAQIDTANNRTTTGSLIAIGGAGLQQRGVLTISARTGVAIDVSFLGAPGATFTVTNGTSNMVVGNFNIGTPTAGDQVTLTLTSSPFDVPVGATLFASPAQPAGTYIGTYTLLTSYQ